MPVEDIIVLASSRKRGGRCVAGISTDTGEWVRPVSDANYGLTFQECSVDGRWPEVLDRVRFSYQGSTGEPSQPENLLLGAEDWELAGELDLEAAYGELSPHLADSPSLFGNFGKAVADEVAKQGLDASLVLLEPEHPVNFVLKPASETYGKFKPRVGFVTSGRPYELNLTDFEVYRLVLDAGPGTYAAEDLGLDASGHTLLTVSLAGAYNGWHHKLVAAVLSLP
jgi:hypothetical protein